MTALFVTFPWGILSFLGSSNSVVLLLVFSGVGFLTNTFLLALAGAYFTDRFDKKVYRSLIAAIFSCIFFMALVFFGSMFLLR